MRALGIRLCSGLCLVSALGLPTSVVAQTAVPPVMVAVLAGERVAPDVASAVADALVAQLTPMAGGRPVVALRDEAMTARLAACGEASCLGGEIASAGAIGAVLARLSRPRRGPTSLSLEILDPVSGAPRLPAQSVELADGADVAATLAPLSEAFRPVMFSPPPAPPRLLVTVNVEGASVLVDDVEVGHAPLARLTLTEGRHTITVRAAGYAPSVRELELAMSDERRIDVVLVPGEAVAEVASGPMDEVILAPVRGPEIYEEWWFWTILGGAVVVGVAVGVGVGVASSSPSMPAPPPDPMGIEIPGIR